MLLLRETSLIASEEMVGPVVGPIPVVPEKDWPQGEPATDQEQDPHLRTHFCKNFSLSTFHHSLLHARPGSFPSQPGATEAQNLVTYPTRHQGEVVMDLI